MGGVLASSALRHRLERGEIFRPNSWEPSLIRGAAYDVRVAADSMVIPGPGRDESLVYGRQQLREAPIVLSPGDVALLTTAERFCMPWDLSANVGVKFSFASQGLIILSGLMVDPGFGMVKDSTGRWVPGEDERLHFLITNVSRHELEVHPLEPIAALQFFTLVGTPLELEVHSRENMERMFFHPDHRLSLGFAFFTKMADLSSEVDELRRRTDEIPVFRTALESTEKRVDASESATRTVVVFGVYLGLTTLLGVALATTLSVLTSASTEAMAERAAIFLDLLPDTWPSTVAFLGFFVGTLIALWFLLRLHWERRS